MPLNSSVPLAEELAKPLNIENLRLPFAATGIFKQDIQVAPCKTDAALAVAKSMREAHLEEEAALDGEHPGIFDVVRENIDENRLLQFLGFVSNIPVGYAAFEPCPCGCKLLIWRFFYVPVQLRKYGLALKLARETIRLLQKTFDDVKIEVTVNSSNSAMDHIFRYAKFKEVYRTGVLSVGEILERRGSI